jgi:replicative DNA helicase
VRPPHSLDAERSLIGAMGLSIEAREATLAARVEPGDFYSPANVDLFAALISLHRRGEPVDEITVSHELARRHDPARVKALGATYVQALMSCGSTTSAATYAGIVRQLAASRRAQGELVEAQELAEGADLANLAASLRATLEGLDATVDKGFRFQPGGLWILDGPETSGALGAGRRRLVGRR